MIAGYEGDREAPAPAPATLMELIALRAQRNPGAIALLAPGRPVLTFGALVCEVERAVRSLAAAGLGRGNRVAVALPNGPELALTLLAVTDCATCVPINPTIDEAYCRLLLTSLHVDALIAPERGDSTAVRVADALELPVLRVAFREQDPAGTMNLVTTAPRPSIAVGPVRPDDLALLMHTSGTTSKAKVAPITHRILTASILKQIEPLQFTSADRCLCVTPLFTTSGIRRNLLAPLVVGGSVVCTSGFHAQSFFEWLDEFEPTYYAAGPAVHSELLAECARRGKFPRNSLRFVWSGATALPAAVESRLESALGVPIIQAYGMSEAGLVASNPLPPGRRKRGSVGSALATEIAILDDTRRPLPPCRAGEIWVRGESVIAGYEDDQETNRQAFHNGWFHTGDLGYLDADGYLFLTGRVKELINRGGLKVSPPEVDAALLRHPEVLEQACFAVAHPTLGEDVAAAVVVRQTATVTPQELRDFAFVELAAFKVPSRIILVPALPKTAMGKLRRRELGELLAKSMQPQPAPPVGEHDRGDALATRPRPVWMRIRMRMIESL